VLLEQPVGCAERALAADRDERIELVARDRRQDLGHHRRRVAVRVVAAAAEQRATVDQQVLEVLALQRARAVVDQAAPTVGETDQFGVGGEQAPRETADRRIETRSVAATGENAHPHAHVPPAL